ncbi:MAG: transglutaminase-like domain-containing protein [Clostridia bacterium]|nr:transglutaminase-like domain-containing protein [Clostridia bacterium]
MTEQLKQQLSRAAMAALLCFGLLAAMLVMLGQLPQLPVGMLAALAAIAIPAAFSVNRTGRIIGYSVMAAAVALWLILGGGYTVAQLMTALTLHLSGQSAVMHMYGRDAALLLGAVLGLLSWLLSAPAVGCLSPLPVIAAAAGLWMTQQESGLYWLIPALLASLTMLVRFRHRDISLRRVLPVLTVPVLAASLLTPLSGAAVPSLKDAADRLRQTVMEYLFYTEPRNVFSLSAEGYYPEGPAQLGGKAEPNEHTVMQVSTPRKVYLRGTVKNEYTGRMWRDSTGGRRYLWIDPRWTDRRDAAFDALLPGGQLENGNSLLKEQTVTVQILSENASSMFVPQRVRSLNPGGELVPYFNNASEIFATRDLQPGDLYTVSAPLMLAGDAGISTIIEACAKNDDPAYAAIAAEYTRLPDHLQAMVYDLARDITRTASTPYEKAFAIQNHLSRNYRYALDVAPQPAEIDFVTNFLFNTKEGYCTYYASAMTVLCRMVGLPARYVEGYLAVPDEQGQAVVTGLQGHAWTEVYFSGFGWLTFDATPGQSNEQPPSGNENPPEDDKQDSPDATPTPPPPQDEPEPSPEPEQDPRSEDIPEDTPPEENPPEDNPPEDDTPPSMDWLWWLLALLMMAALAGRIAWCMPPVCIRRCRTAEQQLTVWAQGVYDALAVMKIKPQNAETPLMFFRRVDDTHAMEITLLPLGQALSLTFYGKAEPDSDMLFTAQETWKAVVRQLEIGEKLACVLRMSFVPMKKRTFLKK